MPTYDYEALEQVLGQALDLVRTSLRPDDVQETLSFLDHAEYGLAFETLISCLVEENVPVSDQLCALLKDAAHRMGYGDDFSVVKNEEVRAALELIWDACANRANGRQDGPS